MHYTYVLRSLSDGMFYVGVTRDLKLDLSSIGKERWSQPGSEGPFNLSIMRHALI